MSREPDRTVWVRKGTLEICVFPALHRAHRNFIWHPHVPLTNLPVTIRVEVWRVLKRCFCRGPSILCQRTDEQVLPRNQEHQRRMRENLAIQSLQLWIGSAKEHRPRSCRTPPRNDVGSSG